ncbi:Mu transposase domain-containing protein [Pyxidicoccus sp. MSG2]|uniref:Mu transposase domain-containing protein n=1 Tax=Pyxidicoccus sp. MSG2 TaxID=2996790 RepID=UPI003B635A5F
MHKLDRELSEFLDTMTTGMGRTERRRAMDGYVTGLLLDGERKSIEPMAARLAEAPDQTEAVRQRLQQCVSGSTWDVTPRACGPYRARTKGKTESGVKYVKRNALAARTFESFAGLQAHLAAWMVDADVRVHGTTHETPAARFERDEKTALRALPLRALPRREQRLKRRVAHDALVDVDTIRYSVPHRLVREHVEVLVGDADVRIFHGGVEVARHTRGREPHARIIKAEHWQGLWRQQPKEVSGVASAAAPSALNALGRSLADYERAIAGGVKRGAA